MTSAREIAAAMGFRQSPGKQEWRGDCPACGYAAGLVVTQRDGRALWWCASCQDGAAVTEAIRGAMGGNWTPPQRQDRAAGPAASSANKTALARDMWDAARPHPGTLVDVYLAARGLAGVQSVELRFHPAAPHPGGGRLPAMIAAIRCTSTGALQAVHRTYLRADGRGKADVEPAKASLGPVRGGAIMLEPLRDDAPLVMAEGIETALSAARLFGGAAWSAISAGNLAALPLPALPAAAVVLIAADPDPPGQRDAAAAARAWKAEGRQVRIATPDNPADDFNDLWRARAARENGNA